MLDIPKIWFLRHGQTEWNAVRRIQGRKDSPLTAKGVTDAQAQARLIAPVLAKVQRGTGGIFASPLGRARRTAEIALNNAAFVIDERLAEIATGEWEGRLRDEVAPGEGDLAVYAAAPGGEDFDALEARVRSFLTDLTGPSIVVSHGLLGQVLRGLIRGLSREEMNGLSNRQGCVYVLENGQESLLEEVGAVAQ